MNLDTALLEMGLTKSANEQEIKLAYRREARQRHPDHNPGAQATASMVRLNVAYSLITSCFPFKTDPDVRSHRQDIRPTEDEIRANTAELQRSHRVANFQPGPNAHGSVNLTLLQAAWGHRVRVRGTVVDLCSYCGGSGHEGHPTNMNLKGPSCFKCNGSGNGAQRKWELDLVTPRGATHGQVITITGEGGRSANEQLAGDVKVKIFVQRQNGFALMQSNLTVVVPVSVWKWLLGGEVHIMTLEGVEKIAINPGQRSFELPLRGWPHPNDPSERGPLTVMVKPVIPAQMTSEQKCLLQEYANCHTAPEIEQFSTFLEQWDRSSQSRFSSANKQSARRNKQHPKRAQSL